jgi:hypothetical protein
VGIRGLLRGFAKRANPLFFIRNILYLMILCEPRSGPGLDREFTFNFTKKICLVRKCYNNNAVDNDGIMSKACYSY